MSDLATCQNRFQIHQTCSPASRIPARSGVGQTGQTIPATGQIDQKWSKLVKCNHLKGKFMGICLKISALHCHCSADICSTPRFDCIINSQCLWFGCTMLMQVVWLHNKQPTQVVWLHNKQRMQVVWLHNANASGLVGQ